MANVQIKHQTDSGEHTSRDRMLKTKRSYEIVYVATHTIIREADNIFDAIEIGRKNCPPGFTFKSADPIKSREHYLGVKKDIANQPKIVTA